MLRYDDKELHLGFLIALGRVCNLKFYDSYLKKSSNICFR